MSSQTAAPKVLSEFQEVANKYKCTKTRRIFQHTVQATPSCQDGQSSQTCKEVTITGTMFTLFQDHAFKGLQHLRRGHILETHTADGYQPLHLEFKAYPKFGNWGERGYPDMLPGPIVLSRKYSGSMILVCCLPDTLELEPVDPADHALSYKHPLGTFYCTSKNGFDNAYSQAAKALLPPSFLDTLRRDKGVTTLVCEVMGLDEHAYADETPGTHLIVHGMTVLQPTGAMEELSPDHFPDIAWPQSVKPVEFKVFDTFENAVAQFQKENAANIDNLPQSAWARQGEGYVALGSNGQRLKFKFWRYLMHREFRVIREAKACPTTPDLLRRFKIMGCTLPIGADKSDEESKASRSAFDQMWWVNALRAWFLLHAGETGPFIAAKDAFLADRCSPGELTSDPNRVALDIESRLNKLPLIIALQGMQCSGKTTLRQRLLPYVRWHGSQDEHGSVAALAESMVKAYDAHHEAQGTTLELSKDRFVALVDRCNKTQQERNNLETALNKHFPGLFVLEYVHVPDVPLDVLVSRFAARATDHMFSTETVGMLRGMEILAQGYREYDKVGQVWHEDLLTKWQLTPVPESGLPPALSIQHPSGKPKPGKVVYSGFGVLIDSSVHGYDAEAQVLRPNSAGTESPGKWYGTHVTHVFGPKDPLPEGVPIDIMVTGNYERKSAAGLINLCGLTVSYVWNNATHMGHITLFCAPGVAPKESNDVLAVALDGTNPLCTRTKLDEPYVLRGFSGTWKR